MRPSKFGASWLAPFDKHSIEEPTVSKSISNTNKSLNYEESYIQELKTENVLAADFRKYKKLPGKDDRL